MLLNTLSILKASYVFFKTERTLKLLSTRDNFRLTLILFLLCSTFQGILMSLNIAIQMDFFLLYILSFCGSLLLKGFFKPYYFYLFSSLSILAKRDFLFFTIQESFYHLLF